MLGIVSRFAQPNFWCRFLGRGQRPQSLMRPNQKLKPSRGPKPVSLFQPRLEFATLFYRAVAVTLCSKYFPICLHQSQPLPKPQPQLSNLPKSKSHPLPFSLYPLLTNPLLQRRNKMRRASPVDSVIAKKMIKWLERRSCSWNWSWPSWKPN